MWYCAFGRAASGAIPHPPADARGLLGMSPMSRAGGPVDLAALRRKLAQGRGRDYWRSLEELAETPEFLASLSEEFPPFAEAAAGTLDRRRFVQLMAASLALGGLSACGPEPASRELLPYVEQPPGIIPGRSRYYATATMLDGYGYGVTIEHQMGRPIKVEGNPDHPASLGGTSAIGQATILGLYDPYRAQAITRRGAVQAWQSFVTAIIERRRSWAANGGDGLYVLTGATTSPTFGAQMNALKAAFPSLHWHQWEAVGRDNGRAAIQSVFGRPLDMILDFGKADVIVAVESDFLTGAPGHLRYARDFASRRRADEVKDRMSRLYALESTPTLAGAKADHRLMLSPAEIAAAMRRLAGVLGAGPAAGARSRSHPCRGDTGCDRARSRRGDQSHARRSWRDALVHRAGGAAAAARRLPERPHELDIARTSRHVDHSRRQPRVRRARRS